MKRLILNKRNKAESKYRKVASFENGKMKFQASKTGIVDRDEKKLPAAEDDMKLPRNFDLISFVAYFVGYLLFNFFYWIDMLSE